MVMLKAIYNDSMQCWCEYIVHKVKDRQDFLGTKKVQNHSERGLVFLHSEKLVYI